MSVCVRSVVSDVDCAGGIATLGPGSGQEQAVFRDEMELGHVGWKNLGGGDMWVGGERSAGC